MLTLDQINPTTFNVLYNMYIQGIIYMEMDGYYVFAQDSTVGFLTSDVLHQIGDTLDQLNVM